MKQQQIIKKNLQKNKKYTIIERSILDYIFGLDDRTQYMLKDIAYELDISIQRAVQLKTQAINKLKLIIMRYYYGT